MRRMASQITANLAVCSNYNDYQFTNKHTSWSKYDMMTSSNGNIFCVTGHLCGEFTGPRWIPHTKASDAELWCFLWSASNKRLSKQPSGWWFEMLPWSLWRQCNALPIWLSVQITMITNSLINIHHEACIMDIVVQLTQQGIELVSTWCRQQRVWHFGVVTFRSAHPHETCKYVHRNILTVWMGVGYQRHHVSDGHFCCIYSWYQYKAHLENPFSVQSYPLLIMQYQDS